MTPKELLERYQEYDAAAVAWLDVSEMPADSRMATVYAKLAEAAATAAMAAAYMSVNQYQ